VPWAFWIGCRYEPDYSATPGNGVHIGDRMRAITNDKGVNSGVFLMRLGECMGQRNGSSRLLVLTTAMRRSSGRISLPVLKFRNDNEDDRPYGLVQ
jgi:hypothetical protein